MYNTDLQILHSLDGIHWCNSSRTLVLYSSGSMITGWGIYCFETNANFQGQEGTKTSSIVITSIAAQ